MFAFAKLAALSEVFKELIPRDAVVSVLFIHSKEQLVKSFALSVD